jgi:ribosomal protein S18 acetylase RimI-like enzyme
MMVRVATESDTDEVVRLAGLMYTSMGLDPDDQWRAVATAAFRSRLNHDVRVVVVDSPGGDGLAAAGAGVVSTRLPSPTNQAGRVGYVQWISTDPRSRRMGLARQVTQALLDWFAEQDIRIVELHSTADGEHLYRSLGFGQDGGIPLRRRAWDAPPAH